jgi:glutathione S-transferase
LAYEFFYWPDIQGRGEFVRLALETPVAAYIDVARGVESEGHGVPAMLALMRGEGTAHIPFAPPFLRDGAVIVSHTAAILLNLGGRIGLAPTDEYGRLWTHQLQLTIIDIVQEVYNSHHPIDEDKWFHEQEAEAIARAAVFRRDRMPKFLGWFEGILQGNPRERTTWSADPPPMQICPCSSWSKDCVSRFLVRPRESWQSCRA